VSLAPHANPALALTGHKQSAPPAVARPRGQAPQPVRANLGDVLPPFRVVPVFASEISIPAATSFGAAGDRVAAWYGLESIRVDKSEPFGLAGYLVELLPTDSAAAGTAQGGGTVTAWGTTRGDAAAIVIGRDLPITRKGWTFAPCFAPGIDNNESSGVSLDSARIADGYLGTHSFPTGKYNDTTPNKITVPRSFLPTVHPFPEGTRLDVALVVRRTQLTGGVAGNNSGLGVKALICHINVQLHLMQLTRGVLWSR
jgi:hypothetical protein